MVAREGNDAPGRLRLGVGRGSATAAPRLQDAGDGDDDAPHGAGTLSPDSLTEDIECAVSNSREPAFQSPERECRCPQWVRCVHFDNKRLSLADRFGTHDVAEHGLGPLSKRWRVSWAEEPVEIKCVACGAWNITVWIGDFDSEADALEAFFRAERELLGGDA